MGRGPGLRREFHVFAEASPRKFLSSYISYIFTYFCIFSTYIPSYFPHISAFMFFPYSSIFLHILQKSEFDDRVIRDKGWSKKYAESIKSWKVRSSQKRGGTESRYVNKNNTLDSIQLTDPLLNTETFLTSPTASPCAKAFFPPIHYRRWKPTVNFLLSIARKPFPPTFNSLHTLKLYLFHRDYSFEVVPTTVRKPITADILFLLPRQRIQIFSDTPSLPHGYSRTPLRTSDWT